MIKLKTLFSLLILFLCLTPASAAILTVTNNLNTNDGVCDAHCSLREAISAAASEDFIMFVPELTGTTINLTATLRITKKLAIDAPGETPITLKGNNTFRIIEVIASGQATYLQLDSITIRDGNAGETGDGGGIYFDDRTGGNSHPSLLQHHQ